MFKELLKKSRSYRRFYEEPISRETLEELVELTRYVPSTANSQALKYIVSCTPKDNEKVFECLAWAGALPEWDGPEEGERPGGYIIILCDLSLGKNKFIDNGIVAQTMMLGAVEKGLGGCMFGSINRPKLAENLGIDTEKYSIDLVLALGKPKEQVVIVDVPEDGNIKYYRDENQVHYVPKRAVEDLLLN